MGRAKYLTALLSVKCFKIRATKFIFLGEIDIIGLEREEREKNMEKKRKHWGGEWRYRV
jgi:hypothetical protein